MDFEWCKNEDLGRVDKRKIEEIDRFGNIIS